MDATLRTDGRRWALAIGEALLEEREAPERDLMGGEVGVALLFAYLWSATADPRFEAAAEARLLDASGHVAELPPYLFSGFTGIAWVMEHVFGRLLAPSEDDVNEGTDESVLEVLASKLEWREKWELMYGAIGFGVYALERPAGPRRTEILGAVLARLEESAEHRDTGIAWRSRHDPGRTEQPYSLGLAHGAAGVIGFLARLLASGLPRARVEALLEGTVRWVSTHELAAGSGSRFPSFGGETTPSRLAWCYGDLALASVLVAAGRAASQPAWERQGLELALAATARGPVDARVVDAGFCHGAVGVAHMFGTLSRTTRDPRFAAASERWFAHALTLERRGERNGGVRSWNAVESKWEPSRGLLGGAAGVGLALITATDDLDPGWERVFLL